MEVLNSVDTAESRIIEFAKSKEITSLEGRNQLIENTIVAIVVRYINPHQFLDRIENILGVPDYENITLLTLSDIQSFCINYSLLIEEWLVDIKHRNLETPNLYRISVNYGLNDLIDLH